MKTLTWELDCACDLLARPDGGRVVRHLDVSTFCLPREKVWNYACSIFHEDTGKWELGV